DVRLSPRPSSAAEVGASRLVLKQLDDRICELVVTLSDEHLVAGVYVDPLERECRRDDRLPGTERVEHLHAHPAARGERRDDDCCRVENGIEVCDASLD